MDEKRRRGAIQFDILDEFWQEKGNKYPPIQRRKERDVQLLYYSAAQYATKFQNYMIKEWGKPMEFLQKRRYRIYGVR